jgi:hypothetical protein
MARRHTATSERIVRVATLLAAFWLLAAEQVGTAHARSAGNRGRPGRTAAGDRYGKAAADAAPTPSLADAARLSHGNLPAPTAASASRAIVESGQAPFPGSLYTFENRWFKSTGDGDLVVYAGAERDDPARGLVAVRLVGSTPGAAAVYHTPVAAGAVGIVAAEGERLTLVSISGARFVFDVSSRTFVP